MKQNCVCMCFVSDAMPSVVSPALSTIHGRKRTLRTI